MSKITQRIARASSSFWRLRQRLWDPHDVKLRTKLACSRLLLYGCETWTAYRQHVKLLEQFQQHCLRSICGIEWQDMVSNLEVLHRYDTPSVESHIIKAQLRWVGHLGRMEDYRIPKAFLFGQLEEGKRSVGRPKLRYKDTVKYNLKECGICPDAWEKITQERTTWRCVYSEGVSTFEEKRTTNLKDHRMKQKAESALPARTGLHVCKVQPCLLLKDRAHITRKKSSVVGYSCVVTDAIIHHHHYHHHNICASFAAKYDQI